MGGLLVGSIKCLGGYSFVWSSYPMSWVVLGPVSQLIFIFLYWISTAVFMGLGLALMATVFLYICKNYKRLFLWTFAPLWLLGEILGSFFVSVILLGSGSYLNINIGHGYLGIALANIPVFYPFASIAGLYGLTFAAAAIGSIFYYIFSQKKWSLVKKSFWSVYVVTASVILYVVFPTATIPTLDQKVIAIDTRFDTTLLSSIDGDRLKAKNEIGAVLAAAKTAPDIILLPEDSRITTYLGGEENALEFLKERIKGDVLIVDTARVDQFDRAILRAFYYDLGKSKVYKTDKQFLTPQGEYITYAFVVVSRLLGRGEQLKSILENQNYAPGEISDYREFPEGVPGLMFCFESSSVYGLSRVADLREENLVLHPVSHSRFHHPKILWFQLESMLRVQAVYTKKTAVSAGNMALSKIYTPDGRISTGKKILETEFFDLIEYNLE